MATTDAPEAKDSPFLDRDLSWLEFNRRVLHEALDDRTPLLERVKFLSIFTSNLDEFFMKRVGRLKLLGPDGGRAPTEDPSVPLPLIRETLLPMLAAEADVYTRVLRPELARHGIHLLAWSDLTDAQRQYGEQFYHRNVFPVLTPLAVDPGHPFPFMSNLSTSLGVLLRPPDSEEQFFARVKVPEVFPQWLALPEERSAGRPVGQVSFVKLQDVVRHNLGNLFPGMVVVEVMPFRITRNAEVAVDEDEPAESLAALVEQELRQRRFERAVRLEYGPERSDVQLPMLLHKLHLTDVDAYQMRAELDFTDLMPIASLNRPELHDRPWTPMTPPALAGDDCDIFAVIRGGDLLVHHPYESFDASVGRFIRQAAEDPRVLALKMTVYRVGTDTHFLDALVRAAEAGKQVVCLVEVTARFDEQQNLHLAHALEKAGVHVVYGVVGLKTHCKTTLVVRQDEDGLRCYAHIGTGNYNMRTARLYTDLGLFTCEPVLTEDVVNLFHYLTGRSRKRDYAKLLVAPVNMRERFLELIAREAEHCRAGRPGRIVGKMNQLQDPAICEALRRASRAGVEIDLIVRGLCTLRPGVPSVSDRIRVLSVIGRFLEHSRIYYFANGSDDPLDGDYYIGSADWMTRNLSDRVEAVAPVCPRPLRQRLWQILQTMLHDRRQAWDLRPDGSYVQRTPATEDGKLGPETQGTHATFMEVMRQRTERSVPEGSSACQPEGH